jgi:hypothetical protein
MFAPPAQADSVVELVVQFAQFMVISVDEGLTSVPVHVGCSVRYWRDEVKFKAVSILFALGSARSAAVATS